LGGALVREAAAADLVLLGGQILPAAGREPVAGGVAVRAGRVVEVGPDDVAGKWIGGTTHVRALSGRLAMPGFFDSHNHLLMTGLGMQRPGLTSATSIAEVLDVARIVRHGDGTVTGHVVGANYVAELARSLPPPSEQTVREAIGLAGQRYSAAGITGVIEPGLQPEEIDAYARLDAEGQLPLRVHMMRPRADHWERLNRLELTVTAQQPLMYALAAGFERYLGAERAQDIEPIAAYLRECHQPVGGGSDSPVAPFQPLLGISSSITRNTREHGVVGPQWAITTEQALAMYTSGSAWCAFQEDRLGSIDAGKDADIVVLSEDIVAEPDSVAGAEVLCTIPGGQVVHDAL
jgi:predicted amidohydrolase YtcJ